MKIKNKYIRNRIYKTKHFKRMRSIKNPYRTRMPMIIYGSVERTYNEQVESNLQEIQEDARGLENGCKSGRYHASSEFKKMLNQQLKARERAALQKLKNGDDEDVVFPIFKKNADWLYF